MSENAFPLRVREMRVSATTHFVASICCSAMVVMHGNREGTVEFLAVRMEFPALFGLFHCHLSITFFMLAPISFVIALPLLVSCAMWQLILVLQGQERPHRSPAFIVKACTLHIL